VTAPVSSRAYFVPEGVVLLPGVADGAGVASLEELGALGDVLGYDDGGGVVGGEAEGERSIGRSPTRSERSVHAAASVTTNASARQPESALFMD